MKYVKSVSDSDRSSSVEGSYRTAWELHSPAEDEQEVIRQPAEPRAAAQPLAADAFHVSGA